MVKTVVGKNNGKRGGGGHRRTCGHSDRGGIVHVILFRRKQRDLEAHREKEHKEREPALVRCERRAERQAVCRGGLGGSERVDAARRRFGAIDAVAALQEPADVFCRYTPGDCCMVFEAVYHVRERGWRVWRGPGVAPVGEAGGACGEGEGRCVGVREDRPDGATWNVSHSVNAGHRRRLRREDAVGRGRVALHEGMRQGVLPCCSAGGGSGL